MATFTAIHDTCVPYPAPLRDFLMRLAPTDLYRARWTDRIHDEWIEWLHPDEFIPHLIDLSPGAVVTAAKLQRQSLRSPPRSAEEFLDALARQGLPETVVRLGGFSHLL